jgi:hypothetical protein
MVRCTFWAFLKKLLHFTKSLLHFLKKLLHFTKSLLYFLKKLLHFTKSLLYFIKKQWKCCSDAEEENQLATVEGIN